ncbi:MAG: DUF2279 domain-containing protein [Candidatus Rokuibacteriota bacterium]
MWALLLVLVLVVWSTPLGAQESADLAPAVRTETPSCAGLSLLGRGASTVCPQFGYDAEGGSEYSLALERSSTVAAARTAKKYQLLLATALSASAIAGSVLNAVVGEDYQSFHTTNEGYFGQRTYAGGADKASHFVDYTILSKELANLYGKIGYSRRDSILLGFGVSLATGVLNEVGDGFNHYGFSWEDLAMDALGASASAAIAAAGLEDLIGFRHGVLIPAAGSQYCCQADPKVGRDYSNEIYTADLALEGLGRRLNLGIGPLRYLLFSATYGVKGYPNGALEVQERQVGLEIGLNFRVILDDLGAQRNSWWGYTLHVIFDNFRIPFTSIGFQYDLNSGRWTGPGNGNGYAR